MDERRGAGGRPAIGDWWIATWLAGHSQVVFDPSDMRHWPPFANDVLEVSESILHSRSTRDQDTRGLLARIRDLPISVASKSEGFRTDRSIRRVDQLRDRLQPLLNDTMSRAIGNPSAAGHAVVVDPSELSAGLVRAVVVVGESATNIRGYLERMDRVDRIKALLDKTSSANANYDALRADLIELGDLTRAELARRLEPAINAEAAQRPSTTYEDKKVLAKWINAELRRCGLAIREPLSGRPCHLVGDWGSRPGGGRFYLDYTDAEGRRKRSSVSVDLPYLRLVPDELTRLPYGSRAPRAR